MLIQPRVLKGFRDFLPEQETFRKHLVRKLEDTFTQFGFVPIDTPILEYTEVLLGKGGGETDKQIYRFTDHGKRDVAMRFDLTVPFARFLAQHRNELHVPFKRFHINKVFRGENTQRGRYREFTQCDFDIVGTRGASADLEILAMVDQALRTLGVPGVSIHVSHRGAFNRLIEALGVGDQSEAVLRTVDKLRKVGADATNQELETLIGADSASRVLEFVQLSGSFEEVVSGMERLTGQDGEETGRLRALGRGLGELEMDQRVKIDPSITRGLDYYTGMVFETFLDGAESIGSVCSGGRYDDLVSVYSKESMPGVGASIGLDRLIAALEGLGVESQTSGAPDVLVVMLEASLMGHYHRLARDLRASGFSCEVYPDPRKLGQQFAFAERRGIPTVLICGPSEYEAGTVNLRRLSDRRSEDGVSLADIPDRLSALAGNT